VASGEEVGGKLNQIEAAIKWPTPQKEREVKKESPGAGKDILTLYGPEFETTRGGIRKTRFLEFGVASLTHTPTYSPGRYTAISDAVLIEGSGGVARGLRDIDSGHEEREKNEEQQIVTSLCYINECYKIIKGNDGPIRKRLRDENLSIYVLWEREPSKGCVFASRREVTEKTRGGGCKKDGGVGAVQKGTS